MEGRMLVHLRLLPLLFLGALAACSGCSEVATLRVEQGSGPNPELPPPKKTLVPTLKIAPAVRWAPGKAPTPAPGLAVGAFARDLDRPRWLHVLPNGDVLVAESNAPERPEQGKGLRGKLQKYFMKKAGAVTPSANRITLLRDADGDGVAETKTAFLQELMSPFGMVLVGDTLYVANADAVVAFPYQTGQIQITAAPRQIADLPAGRNHHWTKSLVASADGRVRRRTP